MAIFVYFLFLKQNSESSQPPLKDKRNILILTFLFCFYLKCTVLIWIAAYVVLDLCYNIFQLRMFSFYVTILCPYYRNLHDNSLFDLGWNTHFRYGLFKTHSALKNCRAHFIMYCWFALLNFQRLVSKSDSQMKTNV